MQSSERRKWPFVFSCIRKLNQVCSPDRGPLVLSMKEQFKVLHSRIQRIDYFQNYP